MAALTKVPQQAHAAAIGRFGQAQKRVELAAKALLEFLTRRAFVNHAALVHHIGQTVAHPGIGGLAIAPGTAGFLVVAFDVFRHIQVAHKTHVGLVDAHAEGDGGDHHNALVAQETILVGAADFGLQPRVVGQRIDALGAQQAGNLFHALARLAVNDTRVALMLVRDKADQLLRWLLLLDNRVADVGAVKTADKRACALKLQPLQNIGAGQIVCGCGERDARHAGVALVQHRQRAVFGAKVVAPLTHAMGLVNCKQAQMPTRIKRIQLRQKARRRDALWRAIQQRDIALEQPAFDIGRLVKRQGRVQKRCTHPRFVQSAHLVVH